MTKDKQQGSSVDLTSLVESHDKPFVVIDRNYRILAVNSAYEQVYGFAVKQRESMQEFNTEITPGVTLGQRLIPCNCAGCYVPGGLFAHAASAIMSIATAKAAGVPFVGIASEFATVSGSKGCSQLANLSELASFIEQG